MWNRIEAGRDDQRSVVGVVNLLPLRLTKSSLFLWRNHLGRTRPTVSHGLRRREGTATHDKIVEAKTIVASYSPRDIELGFQYPEVTIRSLIVTKSRHTSRREDEGVPSAGLGRTSPSILEHDPGRILGQRDHRGIGALRSTPNTPIATTIARTSQTTSAKGSPYRTAEGTPGTIRPRHFFLTDEAMWTRVWWILTK